MNITLSSGREIALARLEQWRTYTGMLAGVPNRESNGRIIESARAVALQHGLEGTSPYLVPPQPTPIDLVRTSESWLKATGMTAEQSAARDRASHFERLPAVTCVAVFESDKLAKPDSEPYSSLTVIWFQEDFALPLDAQVLAHIQSLDWETLATDWIW